MGLAALAIVVFSSSAARSAQTVRGACPPYGGVTAVIDGQPTCLWFGQQCKHRLDSEYRRYGFACPRWGLTIVSRWRIRDLGTLPGSPESWATGINERGEVVGLSQDAQDNFAQWVFLWKAGRMLDITADHSGRNASASINDAGQVLETLSLSQPPGFPNQHAFLWQDGTATDLGSLGGGETAGVAINARGQVIGVSSTATGAHHAFVWQAGAMRDLGTLGGTTSEPTAINANGEIVGRSTTANGAIHAFLWQDGQMRDLGGLDGSPTSASWATAINDHGLIVGLSGLGSDVYSAPRGVRWQNGIIREIDPGQPVWMFANPHQLNNRGEALLFVQEPDTFTYTVVWNLASGVSHDLGFNFFAGDVINERGQITFNTKDKPIEGMPQPFIYEHGRAWILGNLGERWASAADLNEHDQIVGTATTHHLLHAVIWTRR